MVLSALAPHAWLSTAELGDLLLLSISARTAIWGNCTNQKRVFALGLMGSEQSSIWSPVAFNALAETVVGATGSILGQCRQ